MGWHGELERRIEARAAVALAAGVRRPCRASEKVLVTSLSRRGCAVQPAFAIQQGETVWVQLPGLENWEAVVAWRELGRAGLKFVRPLHEAVVDRLSYAAPEPTCAAG